MRRLILASLTAVAISVAASAFAAPPAAAVGDIDVMTQNQYIGADIAPLIQVIAGGGTPAQFNQAVVTALHTVAMSKPAGRVASLAGQIAVRKPHLVGLQDAWMLACVKAEEAEYDPCALPYVADAFADHLALTSSALGGSYVIEAVVQNFAAIVPFTLDGMNFAYLTVVDRDAILARSDVAKDTSYVKLCDQESPSGQGCNYHAMLLLGQAFPPVTRGYVAVQSNIGGKNYLFIDTHLEVEGLRNDPQSPPIQSSQADELMDVIDDQEGYDRLILVGDMNSAPNDPALGADTPYTILSSDLYDAWVLRPGNTAGLSCCQDEFLTNRVSLLTRRIDLIFTREMPSAVKSARLIGEVAADRLSPPGLGLWPSDHASVAAGLRY
ncbi:MAG: hypothetical protein FIB04_10800 [Gammaproteobacteria bacterium]|nr:hypothetical protein [Gammaproteobacteria bacterium]